MNTYIKKIRVYDEYGGAHDKQIDYNALANLPLALPADGGVATKALQDKNGDDITETYATKKELNNIDLSGYATKEEIDNKIADLVNSAPEALNTLNELAEALGDDPNFSTTVLNQLSQKADIDYVDNLFNSIINGEEVYY